MPRSPNHIDQLLYGADAIKRIEEEETAATIYNEQLLTDYEAVLKMPGGHGLRVLWDIRQRAGATDVVFAPNSGIYRNAALRDFVGEIDMLLARADPEMFASIQLATAQALLAKFPRHKDAPPKGGAK